MEKKLIIFTVLLGMVATVWGAWRGNNYYYGTKSDSSLAEAQSLVLSYDSLMRKFAKKHEEHTEPSLKKKTCYMVTNEEISDIWNQAQLLEELLKQSKIGLRAEAHRLPSRIERMSKFKAGIDLSTDGLIITTGWLMVLRAHFGKELCENMPSLSGSA